MSLTPKDWKELKPLFEQAVSLPPEERSAFVEEVRVRSGRLGDQLAELIGAGPLDVLDEPLIKFHEFFPSRSEVLLSQSSGTMPLLKSPVPNETPADIPGNQLPTCLKGRYLLQRKIGDRGAFGDVFLAADLHLHSKPLVVKVMRGALTDEWKLKKFRSEIDALARLNHPDIVSILDIGEQEDGRPFFVMEYVQGESLRRSMSPHGMELADVADILHPLGGALDAAHRNGIWHRDLKPENILIQLLDNGERRVKLIDFGIATLNKGAFLAVTSRMAGTPDYMAPEQLRRHASAASDIYALGVITYEMVTGRTPFHAESYMDLYDLQMAGVQVRPRSLRPDLPEPAERAILKALEPDESRRHAGVLALVQELVQGLRSATAPGRSRGENVPTPPIQPGALLKERYRLVYELGFGPHGRAYLAHDEHLQNKPVAIKLLTLSGRRDRMFQKMFEDDVRTLARIDHPGVVRVLDVGRSVTGELFLVTQYVEGITLRTLTNREKLPLERIAAILRQIGCALEAIHSRGVLHRDLRPENILVQASETGDRVMLSDFGLAITGRDDGRTTETSHASGVPGYMAPVQFGDAPCIASDIFAMAAVAYEMIMGFVPVAGSRLSESDQTPAQTLLSTSLSGVPNQRFQNARVFGDELASALTAEARASLQNSAERVLDVAAAKQIPIHVPAEVVAQVRGKESGGLAAILEIDRDYTVGPEEVRSKKFVLEFPKDSEGRPRPINLTLRIECPDFDPERVSKTIQIPVDRDSEVCTFLITPRHLGEVRINIEVIREDVVIASRPLVARSVPSDRDVLGRSRVLAEIPLVVLVNPPERRYGDGGRPTALLDEISEPGSVSPAANRSASDDPEEKTTQSEFAALAPDKPLEIVTALQRARELITGASFDEALATLRSVQKMYPGSVEPVESLLRCRAARPSGGEKWQCPPVAVLAESVSKGPAPARDLTWHVAEHECPSCAEVLNFFQANRGQARSTWERSAAAVLSLPESSDQSAKTALFDEIGIRLSIRRGEDHLLLRAESWIPADSAGDVEVYVLGPKPHTVRMTLVHSGSGVARGESKLKLADLVSGSRNADVTFLVRRLGSGHLSKLKSHITEIIQRWKTEPTPAGTVEAVCALSDDEAHQYGSAVLGVVRTTRDAMLLVGLSPAAAVHPGDSLHVFRESDFIGVAVVIEMESNVAGCEFQSSAEEQPRPGDLVRLGSG